MKTISLTQLIDPNNFVSTVLYFSQHLFNNDDKIEFMVAEAIPVTGGVPNYKTLIVNEDEQILFSKTNQVATVHPTWHNQQFPIYNTPSGTKMILSSSNGDSSFVYGLTGVFTTFIKPIENENEEQWSELFPNPSSTDSNIEFRIEQEDLPASLKVYNVTGEEIKNYPLNSKEGTVCLETLNLSAGSYFYCIQNSLKIISSKKFLVVH